MGGQKLDEELVVDEELIRVALGHVGRLGHECGAVVTEALAERGTAGGPSRVGARA